jgi:protease PrsW
MDRVATLLSAVTPGIFALAYGIAKTRGRWINEALWTALLLGAMGIAAALPIEWAIQWLVDLIPSTPSMKAGAIALFAAAIPEETIKFLILVGAAETHVDARRRQDIIALAIAVSLGFATVENFVYLLAPQHWGLTVAARALTAVPGHGIDGLAMGALLTAARVRPARRRIWLVSALLIPIIMHAAYDFPLLMITSHAVGANALPWIIDLWCGVLLVSSLVAVGLCNWILPLARQADRASGRDTRTIAPGTPLVVVGGILLVSALTWVALIYWSKGTSIPVAGVAFSILPTVLAADLIWTGVRRYASNRRSRTPTRAVKNQIVG